MSERWLAIVNPRSGHKKSDQEIDEIRNLLSDSIGHEMEFFITRHMGDALSTSRQRRDVHGFIAVGGDGTLFDVINGMDLQSQKLAVFPAGTGNGLARELGLTDVSVALSAITSGKTRKVDLIKVIGTFIGGEKRAWHVATTAALGYTADVVELANSAFKPLGPLCYPVTSIIQAMITKPFRCRTREGKGPWQHITPTNILVNNSRFAGDFEAFPDALIDDGKGDFLVARAGFLSQTAHNLSVLSGKHVYKSAEPYTSEDREFSMEEDRMLMVDGEIIPGIVSARFAVQKGALTVIAS